MPAPSVLQSSLIKEPDFAAAIASYEGTSTDGFVVRSIRKANRNKWLNA